MRNLLTKSGGFALMLCLSASLSQAQTTSWTACAIENGTCTFSGTKLVRYGAASSWNQGIYTNSVACNNATFGDPIRGTRKACETADLQWTTCATEGGICSFSGKRIVRYGVDTRWRQGEYTDQVGCNNSTFGDPAVGVRKSCQIADSPSNTTDTTAPTPPGSLRMTNLACRSGTLSWGASSDNIGVVAYDIYHDGQNMTRVNGNLLSASLTLVPGASWGFYVNAVDAAGNVSQASPTLRVTIPQCEIDTTPPSAPSNLRGTVTGTTANLSWNAASDNIAVTGYDIFRNNVQIGSTGDLSYADSGLTANTSYQYAVAARDAQRNVSPRSSPISLVTGSACSTPVCSVEQATTDMDIPWGLVSLADGSILYSQRDAHDIIRFHNGTRTNLGTVPNVQSTDGEGGLMGLAVTPNFPTSDPWLYIFHTSPTDNRIVRIQYQNGALVPSSHQVLLTGMGRNKYHNGGRLRFGPDGKLYAATGDAQAAESAQDINSLNGKILRLNTNGTIPSDNPYNNYVWSYGHRNPQGLAFDSRGRLWAQEFGNSVMDETNLIEKGGNYGWPDCEGTVSRFGSACNTAGFIPPKRTYTTSVGSCSGIAIVDDVLYVACLRGARVYRGVISGDQLTNVQQLFVGTYGRLRTVEPGVDGNLWMTTSNTGDKDSIANNSNERIFKVYLNR